MVEMQKLGLETDSSVPEIRKYVTAALDNITDIQSGKQELRLTLSALRDIQAKISFFDRPQSFDGLPDEDIRSPKHRTVASTPNGRVAGLFRKPKKIEECNEMELYFFLRTLFSCAKTVVLVGSLTPVEQVSEDGTTTTPDGYSAGSSNDRTSDIPDSAINLQSFKSVEKLVLCNCRVFLLQGTCNASEVHLKHATLLSRPLIEPPLVGVESSCSVESAPFDCESVSAASSTVRETWRCFPCLTTLKCTQCYAPRAHVPELGIADVSLSLTEISLVEGSIPYHTFVFRIPMFLESETEKPWFRVTAVDFSCNNLTELDPSISLLRNLRKLSLEGNNIHEIPQALIGCPQLEVLNLRNNFISSAKGSAKCFRKIVSLNLAGNQLPSTEGLSDLHCMQQLNISNNHIAVWCELSRLATHCASLCSVTFSGNPFCEEVFDDDVIPLAQAIFSSRSAGVKINGLSQSPLPQSRITELSQQYARILEPVEPEKEVGTETETPRTPVSQHRHSLATTPPSKVASLDTSIDSIHTKRGKNKKKIIRKVKRSALTLRDPESPHEVGEPDVLSADPDKKLQFPEDAITGEALDPAAFQEKYGANWLEEFRARRRKLLAHEMQPETRPEDELSELLVSPPQGVEVSPQLFLEPLDSNDYAQLVPAALKKFLLHVQHNESSTWRSPKRKLLFPAGCSIAVYLLPTGSLISEPSEHDTIAALWQTEPTTPTPEVWVSEKELRLPKAVIRYTGKTLVRLEQFFYEKGVGFSVRMKTVTDLSVVVPFKQPVFTSTHYCPWGHGKRGYSVHLSNVIQKEGTEKRKVTSDVDSGTVLPVVLSLAATHSISNEFSLPTASHPICGFVFESSEAAVCFVQFLKKLFASFFSANPVVGWPLYNEPEVATTPLLTFSEVQFPLAELSQDTTGASQALKKCLKTVEQRPDSYFLTIQRSGTEFRIQPEELGMHLGFNDIIGFTFANRVLPEQENHLVSCFIVVLPNALSLLNDANWEGTDCPLDEMLDLQLSCPPDEVEAIIIGFGCQGVRLDFGQGRDDLILDFSDTDSTLRFVFLLSKVCPSDCLVVQLPPARKLPFAADEILGFYQCVVAQVNNTSPAPSATSSPNVSVLQSRAAVTTKEAPRSAVSFDPHHQNHFLNAFPARALPPANKLNFIRASVIVGSERLVIEPLPEWWNVTGPSESLPESTDKLFELNISDICLCRVSPLFSKFPLAVVLESVSSQQHRALSGAAIASPSMQSDLFLLIFSTPSMLQHFLKKLNDGHEKLQRGQTLFVAQLSTIYNEADGISSAADILNAVLSLRK